MALGIVSDKDFDSTLKNCTDPILPTACEDPMPDEAPTDEYPIIPVEELLGEVKIQSRGRGENKATPTILQKIIGEEASIAGREAGLELAESFGLSPSSTSAYANGSTSTASYDKKKPDIDDFIKSRKNRIIKKASAKVLAAIDGIDDDKLLEAPAGVLAGIAKSLSGVIRDLEPQIKTDDRTTNVQFVMFAPRLITEAQLGDVIEVNE